MSDLYLIDQYQALGPTTEINDVVRAVPVTGNVINGNFVVRVPDGVSVQNPSSLSDLLLQKDIGIQIFYLGYTYQMSNLGLFASAWDLTWAGTNGSFPDRFGVVLNGKRTDPGGAQSNAAALLSTPAQVVITWEEFQVVDDDPADGPFTRSYVETPAGDLTCEVSFNNGASWTTAYDGVALNIAPVDQGAMFIARFTNAHAYPVRLGAWSLLY